MTHEMTNFVILFKKTPQVCLRGPTGLTGAGELHSNPLIPCWVHPQHPSSAGEDSVLCVPQPNRNFCAFLEMNVFK